jgi:translation initiation factor eIF-2B subunit beta
VVPKYDYVPPDMVSMFVTNLGGQTPQYIYSVLGEFYSKNDLYGNKDESDED